MTLRVVVLGATGNVGTALLHRLQQARADGEVQSIVGVSRHGPEREGAPYEGVEWHRIDVTDPDAGPRLEKVMRGADAVIDQVWVIRPNPDREFLRKVSAHVTIGAAYKGERALDHYFTLCREDP